MVREAVMAREAAIRGTAMEEDSREIVTARTATVREAATRGTVTVRADATAREAAAIRATATEEDSREAVTARAAIREAVFPAAVTVREAEEDRVLPSLLLIPPSRPSLPATVRIKMPTRTINMTSAVMMRKRAA